MQVLFYTFGKSSNSTAIPGEDVTPYAAECALKGDCSVMSPRISLKHANPVAYNYAHVPTWGRYYFITDWTWSGGVWYASMHCDVLASWRDDIAQSTQYVTRAFTDWDGAVIDGAYPAKAAPAVDVRSPSRYVNAYSIDGMLTPNANEGCYIVGIINKEPQSVGAVCYYAMTPPEFRSFCNAMFSNLNWANVTITEITTELAKMLFNPFQYVASCYWLPMKMPAGVDITYLSIGYWTLTGVNARILPNLIDGVRAFFTVPKHPQSSARGSYLNAPPYTNYTIDFPAVGTIALDSAQMANATEISMNMYVDLTSGVANVLVVNDAQNITLYSGQFMLGIPVAVAQESVNFGGMIKSAGSIISGDFSDVVGIAGEIANGLSNAQPTVTATNGGGNMAAYAIDPVLRSTFAVVVDDNPTEKGRPLCAMRQLSTLFGGYIRCENAHIELRSTADESSAIESFMNGGFYLV